MRSAISVLTLAFLAASAFAAPSLKKKNACRQDPEVNPLANTTIDVSKASVKRGLSFNDAGLTQNFNAGETSWAYNWDSSYQGSLPEGVTYFPMLWSAAPEHSNQWFDNANASLAKGSTHLLFINEPDLPAQANTTAEAAARQWMQFMQPFKGRATLVSPAITNGAPPMGTGWMDDFLAACETLGCTVDAIAAHIYDSATNPDYYQSYITNLGQRYNRPVLITEMGASGTAQEQEQFLGTMVPFLNGLDSVTHFAWFMTTVGNLVNADASLTPLGQAYVSA